MPGICRLLRGITRSLRRQSAFVVGCTLLVGALVYVYCAGSDETKRAATVPLVATATRTALVPVATQTPATPTATWIPGAPSAAHTPARPTATRTSAAPTATRTPSPPTATSTPEPLVPTAVPKPDRTNTPGMPNVPALPAGFPPERRRFGVGVPGVSGGAHNYALDRLGIGWYLNWGVQRPGRWTDALAFWQMLRLSEHGYQPAEETIRRVAESVPGSVWLVGNEPDVRWQDNVTPERYAELYHELYALLKAVDPTCRVAVGGVSQPTPLRMAYLDRVLDAYRNRYGEPMPVDVWNVHAFILREERGAWGVDIPPGIDVDHGVLYEIDDHDDMAIFEKQIRDFRLWMAQRGYQDRPLVVSEYGILMPEDYGFAFAAVRDFMVATFDLFLTARDEQTGYPQDDYRLVQFWAWYSLADTVYPTGNLFDPQTKAMTRLGLAHARYKAPGSVSDQ